MGTYACFTGTPERGLGPQLSRSCAPRFSTPQVNIREKAVPSEKGVEECPMSEAVVALENQDHIGGGITRRAWR